jgi:hypothetical protein
MKEYVMFRVLSSPSRVRPARLGAALVLALAVGACGADQSPLAPSLEVQDALFSRSANLHCTDHQTALKIEVPSDWSFGSDGPWIQSVMVEDTRTGDPVEVTVTIDGSTVMFTSAEELESASFCLKGGPNETGGLTGLTGNTSSIPNRGGQVPDISYVVLYAVVTSMDEDIVECGQGLSVSGGFEIFEATIELGQSSGQFLFEYSALNQPDWYEIFYEGERIFDIVSGTQANNPVYDPLFEEGGRFEGATERESLFSSSKIITFGDATSTSTRVTLRVTGSEPGTVWSATVNCPAA